MEHVQIEPDRGGLPCGQGQRHGAAGEDEGGAPSGQREQGLGLRGADGAPAPAERLVEDHEQGGQDGEGAEGHDQHAQPADDAQLHQPLEARQGQGHKGEGQARSRQEDPRADPLHGFPEQFLF